MKMNRTIVTGAALLTFLAFTLANTWMSVHDSREGTFTESVTEGKSGAYVSLLSARNGAALIKVEGGGHELVFPGETLPVSSGGMEGEVAIGGIEQGSIVFGNHITRTWLSYVLIGGRSLLVGLLFGGLLYGVGHHWLKTRKRKSSAPPSSVVSLSTYQRKRGS